MFSCKKTKSVPLKEHKCYRYWTERSQAMEIDIILSWFLEAESGYVLRYIKVIADRDNFVTSQLQKKLLAGVKQLKS